MNHGTLKYLCIPLLLAAAFPLPATAEAAASAVASAPAEAAGTDGAERDDERDKITVGTRSAQWLDTQREGRAAGKLLPIPGAEAGRSYQRYIDSFASPIPEKLPAAGAQK
jgi:hypothetical protein